MRENLDGLEVVDLEDGKDRDLHMSVKNAFRLYGSTTGESHLLCARKIEQKQRWLKAFAREREQVRLDQETGETPLSFASLRAHQTSSPLNARSGQPETETACLIAQGPQGLVRLQGTAWFQPQGMGLLA